MKLINALIIFFVFFISIGIADSQTIKLHRTDVDYKRWNFVTATYMFGIDITIDNIKNCNGVEFELSFNNTDYIQYSEWQPGEFGENASTVVIPIIDTLAGTGRVYSLVISGDPINEAKINDSTVVIHLDFAVSQKSPHGSQVTFAFVNAHATINNNGIGEVVDLGSDPVVYDIHGFVNVWPGDTDNNGIVDEIDMDLIALHLFPQGSPAKKGMRSFKRQNASTLWQSQRVLAWDSAQVTFADCDGDGNITPNDMMVIPLNFAEFHGIKKGVGLPKVQSKFMNYYFEKPENSVSYPVTINYSEPFIAAAVKISWMHFPDDVNVIGFENGGLFASGSSFMYAELNPELRTADVIIGDYQKANKVEKSGNLFNIIMDKDYSDKPDLSEPELTEMTAMSNNGYIFSLVNNSISFINDNFNKDNLLNFSQSDEIFKFYAKVPGVYNFKLYDTKGSLLIASIYKCTVPGQSFNINISALSANAYYAQIMSGTNVQTIPILVLR